MAESINWEMGRYIVARVFCYGIRLWLLAIGYADWISATTNFR